MDLVPALARRGGRPTAMLRATSTASLFRRSIHGCTATSLGLTNSAAYTTLSHMKRSRDLLVLLLRKPRTRGDGTRERRTPGAESITLEPALVATENDGVASALLQALRKGPTSAAAVPVIPARIQIRSVHLRDKIAELDLLARGSAAALWRSSCSCNRSCGP